METITIILAIALAVFCVGVIVCNYRQDTLVSFMDEQIRNLQGQLTAYKDMLNESNERTYKAEAGLRESREEFNYVKGLLKRAKDDLKRAKDDLKVLTAVEMKNVAEVGGPDDVDCFTA